MASGKKESGSEQPVGASLHPSEEARLADLRALKILDTGPERRFDELTCLMADALDASFAAISLLDRHREWFKSRCGLAQREVPRDHSFCAHAILGEDLLIVPDALLEPRFRSIPLVTGEPRVRFYAGAVLRGPKGTPVGICSVMDRRPRALSEKEERLLRSFASLAARELDQEWRLAQLRTDIEREVFQDPETGLPNDRVFRQKLAQAIELAAARSANLTVVCIRFAELSGLKAASLPRVESELLSEAAKRASAVIGSSEGTILAALKAASLAREERDQLLEAARSVSEAIGASASTIARRGDELALFLPGGPHRQGRVAHQIAEALRHPFMLGSSALEPGPLLGASVFPEDGTTADGLIRAAEAALDAAPRLGVATCNYYDPAVSAAVASRYALEMRLRQAIRGDELYLLYQPKIDARTQAIRSAEALLRWTDSEHGPVSPAEIIGVAERSPLIHELGEWVLRRVCLQIREWIDSGLPITPIAVNVSGAEIQAPDFYQNVQRIIAETGVPPKLLEFELTESALVENLDVAAEHMRELGKLGIAFSIDDFGTGYSGLAYLQGLPFRFLKMDGRFVEGVATNANDAALTQAIIGLGHALQLTVVAEKVESQPQSDQLRTFGCDQFQGYHFAPPLAAAEFAVRLSGNPMRRSEPKSIDAGAR